MFTTNSDVILDIVIAATLGFLSLCGVLLLIAGLFRWQSRRSLLRERKLTELWQAHFHQAICDGTLAVSDMPRLKRRHRKDFLEYWSQVHAYVRGSGDKGLNELAHLVDLPRWLTRYLSDPRISVRLSAITALGYFGKATATQERYVLRALESKNRLLSITALRCLMSLNVERTLGELANRLAFMNWSDSRLVSALKEAPREQVLAVLDNALHDAPLPRALKCYRLAEQLRGYTDQQTTDTLLERFADQEAALSQFLRLVNTPSSRPQVITLLSHPSANIRAQAIMALGRIGDTSDADRLLTMLDDSDNWVRYDAAATILLLPGIGNTQIDHLLTQLDEGSPAHMLFYSLAHTFHYSSTPTVSAGAAQ
ncbi:MAG: HEAT repeat domain-containing protein [Idiomarina sp.]|nr:HEAT repeat domain-containing protein [Idiomarina sp.]